MPKREQVRAVDWRNKPSREAIRAGREYMEEMRRYWAADEDYYRVPVMPCPEVKGEP